MRRGALAALLLLLALLTGCAHAGEVENQAYALVLGVEAGNGGGIALTIRIPRIGKRGGAEDAGEEPYLLLSAEGDSYVQALERLQWATARELNLSHLKLIIVSRALAASEPFPALIRQIAQTRHLYTTAGFIVCEGSAKAFIEGQQTILGTRMSSEISAMFRHYAAHGYIPHAAFADLYYATLSGGSDPTGIWGFLDSGEPSQQTREAAAIIGGDEDGLRQSAQTASSRQYLGAAVLRDGRLVTHLDARETLYLNLLTENLDSFSYAHGGRDYTLACMRRPKQTVRLDGDRVTVGVTLWLSCEDAASEAALKALAEDMSGALAAMIRRCQQAGIEPFGFTEHAAARFLTVDAWQRFNWRSRWPSADVEVRVHIAGSGN